MQINMLLQEKYNISPEEYLSFERDSEIKSEYFDGEIFVMAGASWGDESVVDALKKLVPFCSGHFVTY